MFICSVFKSNKFGPIRNVTVNGLEPLPNSKLGLGLILNRKFGLGLVLNRKFGLGLILNRKVWARAYTQH